MNAMIMRQRWIFSRLKQHRGAAMVEFAIVAPLLFVLLFGIIEFGVILYDQAVITNASREGARWAASYYTNGSNPNGVHPQCADIQNYILNSTYMNLPQRVISLGSSAAPTVTCPNAVGEYAYSDDGGDVGNADAVQVQYTYNFLVFGNLLQLLGASSSTGINLTATTILPDENQN